MEMVPYGVHGVQKWKFRSGRSENVADKHAVFNDDQIPKLIKRNPGNTTRDIAEIIRISL